MATPTLLPISITDLPNPTMPSRRTWFAFSLVVETICLGFYSILVRELIFLSSSLVLSPAPLPFHHNKVITSPHTWDSRREREWKKRVFLGNETALIHFPFEHPWASPHLFSSAVTQAMDHQAGRQCAYLCVCVSVYVCVCVYTHFYDLWRHKFV